MVSAGGGACTCFTPSMPSAHPGFRFRPVWTDQCFKFLYWVRKVMLNSSRVFKYDCKCSVGRLWFYCTFCGIKFSLMCITENVIFLYMLNSYAGAFVYHPYKPYSNSGASIKYLI